MNFAETLKNWRESETDIRKAETSINKIIELRCSRLISNLIKDEFTQIALTEFDHWEFCTSLHQSLYNQYKKEINFAYLLSFVEKQIHSYDNIFVFDVQTFIAEPIEKKLIVFYKKEIENNPQEVFNIIEYLFYEYVLPVFEKKYKEKNQKEITFTPHFSLSYSITPIEKMINEMRITTTKSEIIDILQKLSNTSGMTLEKLNNDFIKLSI